MKLFLRTKTLPLIFSLTIYSLLNSTALFATAPKNYNSILSDTNTDMEKFWADRPKDEQELAKKDVEPELNKPTPADRTSSASPQQQQANASSNPTQNPNADSTLPNEVGHLNFHQTQTGVVADASAKEKARIDAFKDKNLTAQEIAQRNLAEADRLNRLKAQRAASIKAAEEARRERELLLAVNKNLKKNDKSALEKAREAEDPEIRKKLLTAAIANEYSKNFQEKEKKAQLNLAQLLQMAATTMQAATAMNSMDGTSPVQRSQTFDPTKPVAPKAALAGRSPASLGDKEGTVSAKGEDSTSAEGSEAKKELSAKDKETLAKVKAAVEAAEKRKKIQALRLKQKLRERANAQGKGPVDTDELFGGSLNQNLETAESDQAEESAAKESALSVSSVYQAAKEGFSLAGAETDREVGQIVSEAERDLSSQDMSSGVLGRESPSLFTRVHAVHQACQRQKCVLAQK